MASGDDGGGGGSSSSPGSMFFSSATLTSVVEEEEEFEVDRGYWDEEAAVFDDAEPTPAPTVSQFKGLQGTDSDLRLVWSTASGIFVTSSTFDSAAVFLSFAPLTTDLRRRK